MNIPTLQRMPTRVLPHLIIAFIFFASSLHAGEQVLTGMVTKVTDGDTIHVLADNQTKVKVRLAGIDSPELKKGRHTGQPFAQEALEFMTKLVLNKRVKVESHGPDRSGRILAIVFLNAMNVNLEIVKAGLAEIYRGKGKPIKAYREELKKAEKEAQSVKRGMWVLGDKYESPAKYRARTGAKEGS